MKKLFYLLALVLALGIHVSHAQNPIIRIDTVVAIPGDSVSIPIYFSNFTGVGSITLYIEYNKYALTWGKGMNWFGAFNNGFNFANGSGGEIAITCINYNGVTQSQGKLLDLRMKYVHANSTLTFMANCEITDANGIPVNPSPQYVGGGVVKPLTIQISASQNPVCEGTGSQLSVNPSGWFGTYSYQWSSIPAGFTSTLPNPEITPAQNTRYLVTVSEGALQDTASITISLVNLPAPGEVVIIQPAQDTVGIQNPVNFSWNPAENATIYEYYIWQSPYSVPDTPATSGYGMLNYTWPTGLTEGEAYNWKIHSKNACHETVGATHQFTMLPLPDLHITNVEISQPSAGQVLTVSWTVKNDGLGPTTTPVWHDRLLLSVDLYCDFYDKNNIFLDQFPNISSLNPGESYTQTVNVTLPENLYGNYFLFVITDDMNARDIEFNGPAPIPYNPPPYLLAEGVTIPFINVVKERDEVINGALNYKHDNFFYTSLFLTVPPIPDLIVTSIIKPNSIFSGQTININYTVENQGEVSPVQQSWCDKVYLCQDSIFNDLTALPLKTIVRNSTLFPDSSYQVSLQAVIPNNIFGKYFIYVFTDADNQVFEYVFDGNNILRSDTLTIFLTPPPDLVVNSIIVPPSASIKEKISVNYTVRNEGGSTPTKFKWEDKIALCSSPTYDPSQVKLYRIVDVKDTLEPGSSYTKSIEFELPKDISGNWYIYLITDYSNLIFEYQMENNNMLRIEDPILILNPDLIITPFPIISEDSTDDMISLQWSGSNQGPGKIITSAWSDKIYISPEATFNADNAQLIKEHTQYRNLAVNEVYQVPDSFNLPNIENGYYYLYLLTDATNLIYETGHEENNITRSINSIYIKRPDLVTTQLEFPASAFSGQSLIVRAMVKNIGEGSVINKRITNTISFSLTPQAHPGLDRIIYTSDVLCNLSAGDSMLIVDTLSVPPELSGPWFICHTVDNTNTVNEGAGENNNSFVSPEPIHITIGPMPDLQLITLNIPDTISAGDLFSASIVVKNTGAKNIIGSNWQDHLFWSAFPNWIEQSVTNIQSWEKQSPLDIDSLYQQTKEIALPTNLTQGNYYFYLKLDANSEVFENSGEYNNFSGPYTTYVRSYPLDLQVKLATTPSISFGAGYPIQISYMVENISNVDLSETSWRDALYLSTDAVWDPMNDQMIADWPVIHSLIQGESYSAFKEVTLPFNVSGSFYLLLVYDRTNSNPDINQSNNFKIITNTSQQNPVTITTLPTPDFRVSDFQAPSIVYTGQKYLLQWTVINEGDSLGVNWQDKVYLSNDDQINQGDIILGIKQHNQNLLPGEQYTDTLTVQSNSLQTGNYMIIVKTDANNQYYESLQEEDNVSSKLILFKIPPPSDIVVSNGSTVPNGLSGMPVNITWTIHNAGNYTLTGPLKDGIYLSADTVLSADDYLWFNGQEDINLTAADDVSRDTILPMPCLLPGLYYLIIRTDLNNAFSETNEGNNILIAGTLQIEIPELFIDNTETFDLQNLQKVYYKLSIPNSLTGESLVLSLKGDSLNGFNELYASLGIIPDRIHYQFKHLNELQGNQDLYIPSLSAGTYYFLITGSTLPNQTQNISFTASILEFEIRSIESNKGGALGNVTVKVNGSKFTPNMQLVLIKDSILITANKIEFINSTQVYATFRLSTTGQGYSEWSQISVPLGFYDVNAIKSGSEIAVLEDGFEVVEFSEPDLLTFIEYPSHVRPSAIFCINMEFSNIGTNDIPIPVRTLISLQMNTFGTAAIAFNAKDLIYNNTHLKLEFIEPGGPLDVLRPGAKCELKIFCKTPGIVPNILKFKLVE